MATGINDLVGRQKVLEGLWLIGIEPGQLRVDPNQDGNAFLDALHKNGVNDDFIRRAIAGVDWRSSGKDTGVGLTDKVASLLKASGYRQDEIDAFKQRVQEGSRAPQYGKTGQENDPQFINKILTQQFNERTAGAMIYKATGGADVKGAVWNPYRMDQPPKNANVSYGAMGVDRTAPGGSAELPIPPSPRQQAAKTQQALQQASGGFGAPVGGKKTVGGDGGGGGTPGATSGLPAKRSAGDVDKYLTDHYGHLAYLASIPEVANIVTQAEKNGWGDDEITGALTGTNWWKTTSNAQRLWDDQKGADPETAKRSVNGEISALRENFLNKYGIQMDDSRLGTMAENVLRNGWTQAQVNESMAQEFHYQAGSGATQAIVGQLKNTAGDYYVPLSDDAINQWGRSIIAAGGDDGQFKQYVQDQAKSMFPTIAGAIDRGVSVKTFTDPFRQIAAKTLEVPPDNIDFSDPKYLSALNMPDPKTGDRRMMTLSEWQDTLKKDPRYGWDTTQNARDEATNLAQKITTMFGGGV